MPEATYRPGTIDLGSVIEILRNGDEPSQNGDGKEGGATPGIDEDHRDLGPEGVAEPVRSLSEQPHMHAEPIKNVVLGVEHLPPGDRTQGSRHDEGQQHRTTEEILPAHNMLHE